MSFSWANSSAETQYLGGANMILAELIAAETNI